eukprot:2993332-Pyramimonas_sp.AAC.1
MQLWVQRLCISSSVKLPMGPRSAALGGGERMRAVPLGATVELPMGPRNAVLGKLGVCACVGRTRTVPTKRCIGSVKMPNWISRTHADGPTGGF